MGIMTSTLREELTYPLKIDGWKVFFFLLGGLLLGRKSVQGEV